MIDGKEGSNAGRTWLFAGLFLLAAVWIAWLRQPALSTPVWNVDEGITAAIADEILAGGVPYRDATDLRAPLTYYFYAAVFALGGTNNMTAIHVAHTGLVIATALLVLLLGRRFGGLGTAGWSVWIYAGLSCCLFNPLDSLALHTEWPLAFCSAAGAWLYLEGQLRQRRGWLAGAGLCYGLAVLSKQPGLLDFGAPLLIQAGFILSAPADSRRHWRDTFALLFGFALPLLATIGYFAIRGALHDLIFYTWTYNTRYYVPEVPLGNRFPTIRVPLELLHRFAPSLLVLLAASLLVILWRVARSREQRQGGNIVRQLLAPLWLFGSLAATTLSGRGFEHYSIQILAPASLVAGHLLGPVTGWALLRLKRLAWTQVPALLIAVALAAMFTVQLRHSLSYRREIKPHLDPSVAMARIVREVTTRADRIFVWGFYSDFHPLASRLPASRFVHGAFLTGLIPWTNLGRDTNYAIVPGSMETLLADLEKSRPRLIVETSRSLNRKFLDYPPEKFPAFSAYLQQHYIEYEPQRSDPRGWFHFYLRRDTVPQNPSEAASPTGPAPTGTLVNFMQDFSGQARLVIHGADPQGQLQQLGLLVGENEIHAVSFPPARARLLIVPLAFPDDGSPAPAIRIMARTADGRRSLSDPVQWTNKAEIPENLLLRTAHDGIKADGLSAAFPPLLTQQAGQEAWICHAYTAVRFPLPASARRLQFGYGLAPGAYEKPQDSTDGVEFTVQLQPRNGAPQVLLRRLLNPAENPADRGMQSCTLELPAGHEGGHLVLITHPGPAYSTSYDWSYWTEPRLLDDVHR